ncbi:MAG: CatB-related O-acetyltransferase [Candidatus Cloacimonetes bacterium]|nr:CatB-related O-acetyltransferase [Candidatus Cloacimonadota bacterium]
MKRKILNLLPQFLCNCILKLYYRITKSSILLKDSKVNAGSFLEDYNYLGRNTHFLDSYLGLASYIANNSIIKRTKIGKFCAIGDNVRTSLGIHPTNDFVSIHPSFFSLHPPVKLAFANEQLFEEHKYINAEKNYVVEIGNDVWIGNNVLIIDGVTIADGAVIAAGAVVIEDVEPYSIVGGVPAKEIRKRFNEDEIIFLLDLKWWDKDLKWIYENKEKFNDINIFTEYKSDKK